MNSTIKAITLILTLAAVLLFSASGAIPATPLPEKTSTSPTPPQPQPSPPTNANWANYFPLEVGSYWQYDVYIYKHNHPTPKFYPGVLEKRIINRVIINRNKFLVQRKETKQKISRFRNIEVYLLDENGISVLLSDRDKGRDSCRDFLYFDLCLKFPIKIGSEWTNENLIEDPFTRKYKVVGYETVEVPAGKFNAFKVERSQGWEFSRIIYSTWYAEGVGIVKETIFFSEGTAVKRVLRKYKVSKPTHPPTNQPKIPL